VKGLAEGTATITATCDGAQGSVQLVVTGAALVGVEVSTSDPAIPVGADTRFTATGTYTDGSTENLTTSVAWSSSDPTITSVSSLPGLEGVATGVGIGMATVRADADGGVFGTASLQVTDAVLTSLAVQVVAPIPLGLGADLAASGTYSDGTVHDLTTVVTWTSLDETVVTVSNAAGTQGRATSVGKGTATVRGDAAGGIFGTTDLQVTDAVLVSVAVQPVAPIALGSGAPLAASGTYTDGSVQDLTSAVAWTSSDESVVTVSSAGLATGVGKGSATVRAEAAGGIFGTAGVEVTDAVLTSVSVQPVAPLALGLDVQLAAAGHYSDGAVYDLTDLVTWSSSDGTVVAVSNDAGKQGLATGTGLGAADVTATGPGGLTGSVTITVTAAQLVLVDVAPIDPEIVVGTTLPLTATGTYSDDSTADLTGTGAISWSSSNPAIVSVDAAGVVTGVAVGAATVTATDVASGLSSSIVVTVAPATAPTALSYLSLSRGATLGGGSVTGTVVLTRPATSNITVALASGDPCASVPATVVIAAGKSSATFQVATTAPNKHKVRVTIGATYAGVTKIAKLNVRRPH
jgi:uncharacterized protein YjdB